MGFISFSEGSALLQVILIDLVLAADNALVVGMAVAGLAPEVRRKAIFVGIGAAVVLRIIFSLITVQLLKIDGILIIGGALLLWVAWKLYGELRENKELTIEGDSDSGAGSKSLTAGIIQVLVADISMSLDNVLAVAGASGGHTWVLVVGLTLSVVFMAVAATWIAGLLNRYPWIGWLGLLVIVYVGFK